MAEFGRRKKTILKLKSCFKKNFLEIFKLVNILNHYYSESIEYKGKRYPLLHTGKILRMDVH